MAIKNRTDLKSYFVKNAIPTEGNFAELIDSQLNQAQDGVFKPDGEPLSVVAAPGDQKRVLRLYANYPAANPDWMISLNPAQDPAVAGTGRAGFGVTDGAGNTRLFVDAATGQIGVGTNAPQLALDVVGGVQANGFRGRYDLVLNDYRTVNPASNVCLHSPPGDRDTWIYRDTADASSNWGIYHRQIDTPVAGVPASSIAFIGGGGSSVQAYVGLADGAGYFAGKVTAATMEIGGPNPVASGAGGGVLYLRHHGVVAHQLRYNGGTLFFEAAGNGYGTNPRPTLALGGDVSIEGKHAFRGNDSWLRLNQDRQFGSGVYTPGALRADGGIQMALPGGFFKFTNVYLNYVEIEHAGNLWGINKFLSQRAAKKNIEDLDKEIDTGKLHDLRPVVFNWTNEIDGAPKTIGLIAEDVEVILPQLVLHDGEGKPFAVDYSLLAVMLLNELKKAKQDP